MFERIDHSATAQVRFSFNGETVIGNAGDSIAAALLAAGHKMFRKTPTTAAPRGPFCMMGSCFDCLVVVDGETVQACQIPALDGLVVTSPPVPKAQP
ncbi:(2Fe-2S)-binding protein [Sulfitobacter mediterraneus]|uniref:(2Fe-2S)-binding protein n=1 Tax=Sulfitobacter mediterraneus TaxID=83219 RepID=A0A061SUU6_9RHOB|nr:(2Fe-2S)-binding protein [Sulfitobacter mediterraneus]KAJ03115.1 (2Fe-2S)-binding protein [Sulfitobacter mediterraneus]MBM1557001.1 (2Fe-2S)-binding protein [Sulfitobacter mediterraneus]MBM1569186.1 (2Fe-2S)-binding protein [Sulfitobacter mediterraneus]MBM1572613.1 (2Fe-2S)-binding protein [Sulfitobacter mediterraneus]MBM1576776.1 (2Fe-2S)-binding protein [Sulfitobacter mediterraneus]